MTKELEFRSAEEKDVSTILLEDLVILPEYRGRGYGKAMLKRLAQITIERG